jgi:XFP C-terminal domain
VRINRSTTTPALQRCELVLHRPTLRPQPFTGRLSSFFVVFLIGRDKQARLVRNLAVGFSPTQPSLRSRLRRLVRRLPSRGSEMFHRDKPITFNFHGYPWLIRRLAYRRTTHKNRRPRIRGCIEVRPAGDRRCVST